MVKRIGLVSALLTSLVGLSGCNVTQRGKPTGGVDLGDGGGAGGSSTGTGGTAPTGSDAGTDGSGGSAGGDPNPRNDGGEITEGDGAAPQENDSGKGEISPPNVCARAITVIDSDYTSTNVSVISPDGKVLSESIVSSGSAPAGISTALSGDVVLPSAPQASGRLVLIDRTNAALTWIDPKSAKVLHQLSVGTGFGSNPHDYLEVSATKAYVTRYETNPTPGKAPFDAGGDVLVVDPTAFSVTASIPLAKPDDGVYLPRADRMLSVGGEVWVMLERLDASFAPAGSSRIAGIDTKTDEIAWTLDLPNAENCGGVALSPSRKTAAVSCSGDYNDPTGATGRALILLDATTSPPKEIQRFDAATTKIDAALGPSLAFAGDNLLVGVASGNFGDKNDIAFALTVDTGDEKPLFDAGNSYVLGGVYCTPGCSARCFLADAQANGVRSFTIGNSGLTAGPTISVDPSIGLPPRELGPL